LILPIQCTEKSSDFHSRNSAPSCTNIWFTKYAIKETGKLACEISRRPLGDGPGLLLLPLLVAELLSRKGETLTVLDFGGGAASGLKQIFEHVPNPDLARLRYILVETPSARALSSCCEFQVSIPPDLLKCQRFLERRWDLSVYVSQLFVQRGCFFSSQMPCFFIVHIQIRPVGKDC